MPPKNPFTQPIGVEPAPSPTQTNRRIVIISLVALAIIPAVCGGIAGVGYLAIKRIAQPSLQVNLPPRKDAFRQDAADFNRSLEQRVASKSNQRKQRVDRGLQRFIDNHIELLTQDDAVLPSVDFSPSTFIEAVATSEAGDGQINIAHRLTLADWIRTDAPQPNTLESQTHVLDVRLDADGKLAVVDLISYSDWNQARSIQWFLVYEDAQWKFYDWQRLEYGRRISDEYASFIVGDSPRDQGYDKALIELARADTMWDEGRRDEAIELLRSTELAVMLPSDYPVFQIRAAYTWMQFDKYDEAARMLESVKSPDARWGVWPTLAVCYWSMQDYDATLRAAERATQQSPNHPNAQWILAEALSKLDRDDEAAEPALRASRVCPNDSSILSCAIANLRGEDVPTLVDIIAGADDESRWTQLFPVTLNKNTELTEAIINELRRRQDLPPGVLLIAEGNRHVAQDEPDEAARKFLRAEAIAKNESFRESAAEYYLDVRLEHEQLERLFDEIKNRDDMHRRLVARAYDGYLDCDTEEMLRHLTNLKTKADVGWLTGLAGWAAFYSDEYEEAAKRIDQFLRWRKTESTDAATASADSGSSPTDSQSSAGEDWMNDDGWIDNAAERLLASSLLEAGRPLEVIERWPDDHEKHSQLGSHCRTYSTDLEIAEFINATSSTASDSVRVQRFVLGAALLWRKGNVSTAAKMDQKAIRLASTAYALDSEYMTRKLIDQFASDLVQTGHVQSEMDLTTLGIDDMEDHQSVLESGISEAIYIGDHRQVEVWSTHALNTNSAPDSLDGFTRFRLGEYFLTQGNKRRALEQFQKSFLANEEAKWARAKRLGHVIHTFVQLGEHSAAIEWIDQHVPRDEKIPARAIVALAQGDFKTLQSYLAAVPKETAVEWLQDQPLATLLDGQAETGGFRRLIESYPIRIPYLPAKASGFLLLQGKVRVNPDSLGGRFESVLGEKLSRTSFSNSAADDRKEPTEQWLYESENGTRIFVRLETCRYKVQKTPAWLRDRLRGPTTKLTISIGDSKPDPVRRLFELAGGIANQKAIAFRWPVGTDVWSGPDLREQLKWRDRVPTQFAKSSTELITIADDDEEEISIDINGWKDKLSQSKDELTATLSVYACGLTENIPCSIQRVDATEYDIYVTPHRDSIAHPLVRSGVTYTCGPSQLQPR